MQEPSVSGCGMARPKLFARIVDVAAPTLIMIVALLVSTIVWAQEKELATAQRLSTQAEQLEKSERYREAIPLAERALAIYENALGPTDWNSGQLRFRLVELYLSAGAFEQAEALLRQSFARFQKTLGPEDRSGLHGGSAFLLPNQAGLPPQGYGLYTYLLLRTAPKDEAERGRYLRALEAYLRILQPMEELEKYQRSSRLNRMLIPAERAIELPADVAEPKRAAQTAESVLSVYDYTTAMLLVRGLDRDLTRGGPYVISSMSGATSATHLFLDMSHVAPSLIWEWIKTFCWLAAKPRTWSEVALQKLAVDTRNAIAIAARDAPDVVGTLQQRIRVIKVK